MKYDYTIRKEKSWLEKGSYTGDIKTEDNSKRNLITTIYRYFMTNNYFNFVLILGIFSFLFTGLFWLFFDNSNAVIMATEKGNFFYNLGENSIVKASCILGAFITSFIAGYSQFNYLLKTKANTTYILGFISFNFVIYLCLNLYFILYLGLKFLS